MPSITYLLQECFSYSISYNGCQYSNTNDCYHLLFILIGAYSRIYLISLLFIIEYLYLVHLLLIACSRIYLMVHLCVMIRSYDSLWIHEVIHLLLVWVIVIIPLLSLFWTSTLTRISYMLISKFQDFLFNLIARLELVPYEQRLFNLFTYPLHFTSPIYWSICYSCNSHTYILYPHK